MRRFAKGGAGIVRNLAAVIGIAAAVWTTSDLNPAAPVFVPRAPAAGLAQRSYCEPVFVVDQQDGADIMVPAWDAATESFTYARAGDLYAQSLVDAEARRKRRLSPGCPPNLERVKPPDVEWLRKNLVGCPHADVKQFVEDISVPGFTGLPLRYKGPPVFAVARNGHKVYQHADLVHARIAAEWELKHHLGPFDTHRDVLDFLGAKSLRSRPIIIANEDKKPRVCHNDSWDDRGRIPSTNECIDNGHPHFQSAEHVIASSRALGRTGGPCEYVCEDKEAAYHQWPQAWEDLHMCVFRWYDVRKPLPPNPHEGPHLKWYISGVLAFGTCSAVDHYHAVSRANRWLAVNPDTPDLVTHLPPGSWRPSVYVDDLCATAQRGYGAPALQRLLEIAARSRQPTSLKKLLKDGAVTSKKTHCGVLIDGVAETASIPPEKIPDARRAVAQLCKGGRWTDRLVVQRAAGTLGHLGQCSAFARRHLRSFYRAMEAPGKRVRRTAAMAEDARWWRDVWATGDADGEPFNGTTYWPDRKWLTAEREGFYSDACMPSIVDPSPGGYGAVYKDEYFFAPWGPELEGSGLVINHLEALTTLGGLERWGPRMRCRKLILNGDNQVACGVQNRLEAKEPALDAIGRGFERCQLRHSIRARSTYVPTDKMLADPLSRGDEVEFLRQYAEAGCVERFGPARRVPAPTAWMKRWLRRLARVKGAALERQQRNKEAWARVPRPPRTAPGPPPRDRHGWPVAKAFRAAKRC